MTTSDENNFSIVTGAAGFIGSHLAERLLAEGHKVIGIDCFRDYYARKIKKANLEQCLKNDSFIFLEKNILNLDFTSLTKQSRFLFHQAAQPGVRLSWGKEFKKYTDDNILATQRILEAAKESKSLKKIIFASSSSVYGNQNGLMKESTIPKPISPYGVTKLAAESLAYSYFKNYNLPITMLRYFTVYGPRQRPDMAFTRFIHSALSNKKISVFGDGSQMRDFTFISDIVDANLLAAKSNTNGNIVNVGGSGIYKVNDVLKLIEEITGKKLNISYESVQKGDVLRTEADISTATKQLGYCPKIKLEAGISKQIEYIKDNIDLYN